MADLLGAIVALDSMVASIQATRARVIDAVIQASALTVSEPQSIAARDLRLRSVRAELAAAMRVPERTAERMLVTSEYLVHALPNTLTAMAEGRVSYRHAEALVQEAETLEAEAIARLEEASLPHAETLTVAKFQRKLRVLREATAPGSAIDRHEAEVARREVTVSPARDGMAWFSAYIPAADALGAYNRLTDMAKSLRCRLDQAGEPDAPSRTLAQIRADVFVQLLHAGEISAKLLDTESSSWGVGDWATSDGRADAGELAAGTVPVGVGLGPGLGLGLGRDRGLPETGIRATVHVTVPVLTLLGHALPEGTAGATLDGYGPIDDETARRLAGTATSFQRILTHPESGAVLSVGRESYAVPADLRRWLQVRDKTCRFIGCSQSALRCDVDHTVDWQHGGETAHDNLAHLCRGHHTLKHHTGWSVRNSNGRLTWTSPAGREYVTEPEFYPRL
nr:DUF222 domain-containing protein [Salinibacterium sp.]